MVIRSRLIEVALAVVGSASAAASLLPDSAASLSDALKADDEACSSGGAEDGEGCSLRLMQLSGSRGGANVTTSGVLDQRNEEEDGQDHDLGRGVMFWQKGRETLTTCMLYHCPRELGPTECHHWRCICAAGYKWSSLTNKCEPSASYEVKSDTGGSCWIMSCHRSRGPTVCEHHHCFCIPGYKANRRGVCELMPSTTTTTTTTPWLPPPEHLEAIQTTCAQPKNQCGGPGFTGADCCEMGNICISQKDGSKFCEEPDSSLEIPRYAFPLSLHKPSKAPLHTYYVYRAQADTSYPPENVNAASLAGVMWYLHNEIVGRADWGGKRKFQITRILRYKFQTRATQPLYDLGMNYGVRFAFDSGMCTGPFSCNQAWQRYGYFVGCNAMGNFKGFPFPDFPVAYDGIWYSFPGKCPQMNYQDKTKKGTKGMDCLENQPGGYCEGEPTGTADCTYNFESAGNISVDELTGIEDYEEFIKAGNLEYDRITDKGTGMTFWDGLNDPVKSKWRVQQAKNLFNKHYPGSALPDEPPCDFDFKKFYHKTREEASAEAALTTTSTTTPPCKTAVPGDECYKKATWAKSDGIFAHPDWYPGLTSSSPLQDFQEALAKSADNPECSMPCKGSAAGAAAAASPANCKDAVPGDTCYQKASWAKSDGVYAHPDWYPGLSGGSSLTDFQQILSASGECPVPCRGAASKEAAAVAAAPTAVEASPQAASGSASSCAGLAHPGDACSQAIEKAKSDDIWDHPDWFPGLTALASDVDFQKALAKRGTCPDPGC